MHGQAAAAPPVPLARTTPGHIRGLVRGPGRAGRKDPALSDAGSGSSGRFPGREARGVVVLSLQVKNGRGCAVIDQGTIRVVKGSVGIPSGGPPGPKPVVSEALFGIRSRPVFRPKGRAPRQGQHQDTGAAAVRKCDCRGPVRGPRQPPTVQRAGMP